MEALHETFDCTTSGSEAGDNDLTAQERRLQELAQQQGGRVPGGDMNIGQVPLDASGEPSSIGSINHDIGECRICIFFISSTGCSNGVMCPFCHLPHKNPRRKNKLRPCKGKRDRYRKLLTRLAQQVEQDPDGFCVEDLDLPPSISSNEGTKRKLIARIEMLKEQVKAQQQAGGAGAAGSSSGPSGPTALLLSQLMDPDATPDPPPGGEHDPTSSRQKGAATRKGPASIMSL